MRISDWSSDVCSSDLPAVVELAFEARNPFGRGLMRGMGRTRRIIEKERLFRRCGMLAVQPSDSMIDEVLVQHQGRIPALQIHWLGAVIERGPELNGFRTDEAVKFFKAETWWPMRKRAQDRKSTRLNSST